MNITLAIDDDLAGEARSYAERHGTTINGLIREYLKSVVNSEHRVAEAKEGMKRLIESSVLEFEPGTNTKELSRDRDPNKLSGHQRSDSGHRKQAGR